MDKIYNLIKQANELIENENYIQLFNNLQITISKQETEINKLTMSLVNIDNIYLEQIKKVNLEIESKTQELKQKNEEIENFAKFSIIQKVNKQLEEKNNYIQILESQIERFKKNKTEPVSPKITLIEEQNSENKIIKELSEEPIKKSKKGNKVIEEPIKEQSEEPNKKSKKGNKVIEEPIKELVEEPSEEPIKKSKNGNKVIEEPIK